MRDRVALGMIVGGSVGAVATAAADWLVVSVVLILTTIVGWQMGDES